MSNTLRTPAPGRWCGSRCTRQPGAAAAAGPQHLRARRKHQATTSDGQLVATAAEQQQQQDDGDVTIHWDPTPFVGPIRAVNIEGSGRGLVATRDIQPGELLLCCHPLAVVTGPQQQRLSVDQLQVDLAKNINPAVTAWLDTLYDGSQESTNTLPDLQPAAQQQQQQQREQQQQQQQQPGGQQQQSMAAVTDALLQRIMDVVRFNAYSDLHDDLAAAAAAGQQPVAVMGLWPEFSLLNHSCVPNCINWVLPGPPRAMIVRAARPIPRGQQATISYLGGPQLLPLGGRSDALDVFGFSCCCPRCLAEEDLQPEVMRLMEDINSRVSESFIPRLRVGVSGGDVQLVATVRAQAAAMMSHMYTLLRRHLVHPKQRYQLLSSCFGCLEVVSDADMALGDDEAAADSLQKCLEAAAAVTPGSDLHCIIAAKLEALLRDSKGAGSAAHAAAWRACVDAHTARYGPLSEEQLHRLFFLNRTLYV